MGRVGGQLCLSQTLLLFSAHFPFFLFASLPIPGAQVLAGDSTSLQKAAACYSEVPRVSQPTRATMYYDTTTAGDTKWRNQGQPRRLAGIFCFRTTTISQSSTSSQSPPQSIVLLALAAHPTIHTHNHPYPPTPPPMPLHAPANVLGPADARDARGGWWARR